MTNPELIALVERYFAAVDAKDVDATLAVLAPDCSITVETAGVRHCGRDTEIRGMFERLFGHFESFWHGDFNHVVDDEAGTVASQFLVRNLAADGTRQEKHNCNFFWVKNGQISAVSVYMTGVNTLT